MLEKLAKCQTTFTPKKTLVHGPVMTSRRYLHNSSMGKVFHISDAIIDQQLDFLGDDMSKHHKLFLCQIGMIFS